ncbi:MAG: cytochrome c family protein, partial [Pseudomonadota bacterium]
EEEAAPEETSEEAAAASDDTAAEAVTDAADSTAAAVEETVETVAEDVTAASEETAETVTEAVEDTATAVSDAASDTAAAATEDAAEAADATTESVGDLAAAAADAVEETAPAAATGPYAALLAAADAGAGKKVFRKCRACHKLEDGKNGVGPHLWGVVGRDQGSVEGYNYSDALKGLGGSWTLAELDAFLEKPKSYAPGTKMAFGGLKKPEDRINLIVYLNEEDGSPEPLE